MLDEHFDDADEIYDAIGDMLLEIGTDKDEGDIRELCEEIFQLLSEWV